MKLFIFVEILPFLLCGGFAAYGAINWKWSPELVVGFVILGALFMAILMLYRIISGFIAFFRMFDAVPTQMAQINVILGRVLGGPRPQDIVR